MIKGYCLLWTKPQCDKLFNVLKNLIFEQKFDLNMSYLICEEPGSNDELETKFRIFMRKLFLDPYSSPADDERIDFKGNVFENDSTTRVTQIKYEGSCNEDSTLYIYDKQLNNSIIGKELNRRSSWSANENLWRFLWKYPYSHQARFLFILYGPLYKGKLTWSIMCENTAANAEQLKKCFGSLGWVFKNMISCITENHEDEINFRSERCHRMCKCIRNAITNSNCNVSDEISWKWTKIEDALVVFDEMVSCPSDWLVENVACLLYASDRDFMKEFMKQKAVAGFYPDLTTSFTSLCLVLVKIQADLSHLLYLVEQTCKSIPHAKNRAEFLDLLSKAFQDIIIDLYENEEVEERLDDFVIILKAQSDFCRVLLRNLYEKEK